VMTRRQRAQRTPPQNAARNSARKNPGKSTRADETLLSTSSPMTESTATTNSNTRSTAARRASTGRRARGSSGPAANTTACTRQLGASIGTFRFGRRRLSNAGVAATSCKRSRPRRSWSRSARMRRAVLARRFVETASC
jgi:hypothetical protein